MIRPPNFATFSEAPKTATDKGCRMSRTVAREWPPVIRRASRRRDPRRLLPSLERRRSLFSERRHALVRVVRCKDMLGPALFQRRRLVQTVAGLRADTLFDRLHRE